MISILKEYLIHQKTTGAICSSSSYLAEAMTSNHLLSVSCVVELGPGTGAITERIMTKISPDCTFFTLEINPVFSAKLKERFPDTTVYVDSAENIQNYLHKHDVQQCDVIISSLPWSLFNQRNQQQIFESVYKSLSTTGKMMIYSYLHGLILPSGMRFKKLLHQHFSNVQKKIIWKNFPPAVVYECKK